MNPPDSAAWYCIRTQTKREHLAAEHLRAIDGVDVFCPRLRYRKATKRGRIWWIEPLFPGYLLAKFKLTEKERPITYCHGVRGLVRFGNETPQIPETFIENLRKEIRQLNPHDDTIPSAPVIEIGDEVEIAHGPFQGMSGTVLSITPAKDRVNLLLEFLGQANSIEIDLFSLILPRRPLPPSGR